MATFRVQIDTMFDAENLEDACLQIIAHFMAVADIECHDIDACSLEPAFLDHIGSFYLYKEQD